MNEENIVLTLNDNKKYVLVHQVWIDNIEYYYLAEIENPTNLMFCEVNGSKLKRVTNPEMIQKIVIQIGTEQKNNSLKEE